MAKNKPSSEEHNRIVADAVKQLSWNQTEEIRLRNKLDIAVSNVQKLVLTELQTAGFIRDEEVMMNKVAGAFESEFASFSGDECRKLLSSFLAINAIQALR